MDFTQTGALIRSLRREKGYTQAALAQKLNLSDKTISKWERGLGLPDVGLLSALSSILEVDLAELLTGKLAVNSTSPGNIKKTRFYVCPSCGNLLLAAEDGAIYCCGKKLEPLTPVKAAGEAKLTVEKLENDYFISSDHPMEKNHYVSFVALLTADTLVIKRLYPDWNLQLRLPQLGHGLLLFYCTKHGLFQQYV